MDGWMHKASENSKVTDLKKEKKWDSAQRNALSKNFQVKLFISYAKQILKMVHYYTPQTAGW